MSTDSAAAAINPSRINPFANMSNIMLADEIGDLDEEVRSKTKRLKDAQAEMERRKRPSLEGNRFIIVKTTKEQLRFDSASVKIEMGAEWYNERRKSVISVTYTVSPIAGAPTPADPRAAADALFKGRD